MTLVATKSGKDSRPIIVSKFKFKIICKILVDRFVVIASRVIFPNQNEFVKSGKIKDCICIIS